VIGAKRFAKPLSILFLAKPVCIDRKGVKMILDFVRALWRRYVKNNAPHLQSLAAD
jgi:hypothetical protein